MACNNQFRHVCLKDLENYIKRDEYFSDFSDEEKAIIKKNLGITTSGEFSEYDPIVHLLTYDTVLQLKESEELKVGHVYVIQDFQTIYSDGSDGVMKGKTYWLFLHPTSKSTFDPRVGIFCPEDSNNNCSKWTVEYDIARSEVATGKYNKGTITYLKDQNNNEAFYDFKNIKFKKTLDELKDFPKTYTKDTYFYTFDNDGLDGSEHGWKNNRLGKGAIRNIFLNDTENTSIESDCHDNVFAGGCINSRFGYGTFKNIFKDTVYNCIGVLNNAKVGHETNGFNYKRIDDFSDKYAITYLDKDTETFQVKMYGK